MQISLGFVGQCLNAKSDQKSPFCKKSEYEPRCEKTGLRGFRSWPTKNQAVQPQKMARGLKFPIEVEEGYYYPFSENKGADQLRSNCTADLRLCFAYAESRFSHDEAHIVI